MIWSWYRPVLYCNKYFFLSAWIMGSFWLVERLPHQNCGFLWNRVPQIPFRTACFIMVRHQYPIKPAIFIGDTETFSIEGITGCCAQKPTRVGQESRFQAHLTNIYCYCTYPYLSMIPWELCLSCLKNILRHISKHTGWWFGTFLFFHILGIIIPFDQYFSEGFKPPTSICLKNLTQTPRFHWIRHLFWGPLPFTRLVLPGEPGDSRARKIRVYCYTPPFGNLNGLPLQLAR